MARSLLLFLIFLSSAVFAVTPSVSVSPASVTLNSGATQQFTATTTGMANHVVIWKASAGTITSSGLFTAPSISSGSLTVTVKATSSNHPKVYGTATVTVIPQQQTGHVVDLTWQESGTILGFNLYRSLIHGGPYSKINSALIAATLYCDQAVLSGSTYYYVVTAVDSTGAESLYSNEAQAVVPSP